MTEEKQLPNNVISIVKNKQKIDKPESQYFHIDQNGVEWFVFTCSYTDEQEKPFGFTFWATSFDDANARLKSLKENAAITGQLHATYDA